MHGIVIDGVTCYGAVEPDAFYDIIFLEQPATITEEEIGKDETITDWHQVIRRLRKEHKGDIVEIHSY